MFRTLKALRTQYGLNQTEMGQLLGINKNTYNFKENGKNDFTLPEVIKIIQLFERSFDEIFFNDYVRDTRTN